MPNTPQQTRRELIDRLKRIGEAAGISQATIAQRTGLKQSNISRAFGGKYSPKLETVIMIAEAVGATVEINGGGTG